MNLLPNANDYSTGRRCSPNHRHATRCCCDKIGKFPSRESFRLNPQPIAFIAGCRLQEQRFPLNITFEIGRNGLNLLSLKLTSERFNQKHLEPFM